MAANDNDRVRELMLQYFYDRNRTATSVRGKRGSQIRISDVKKELKEQSGLSQAQVISNLTYLLERGWVTHHEEHRTFTAPGGTTQPSTIDWYAISADGIDMIEGDSSAFKRTDPFAGVNITAVGSTVQVGNGNYVNSEYASLPAELDSLNQALTKATTLTDTQKLSAVADIETVKAQLAKTKPSPSIVRDAWDGVQKAAALTGLGVNAAKIAVGLADLLA